VVRSLLPLAMMVFLCSFSFLAFYTFVEDATGQKNMLLFGTNHAVEEILRARAIAKILPSTANADAAHPLQLTVDDLAKANPLPFPSLKARGATCATPASRSLRQSSSQWFLLQGKPTGIDFVLLFGHHPSG